MKKLIVLVMVLTLAFAASVSADVIAQWTYQIDQTSSSATGTLNPAVGTGTTGIYGTGLAYGGSDSTGKFYSHAGGTDTGWGYAVGLTSFTSSVNGGLYWNVDTTGYENITMKWDWRITNTGPKNWAVLYTTDNGASWIKMADYPFGVAGSSWQNGNTVSFGSITGINGFRLAIANNQNLTGGTVASTGTVRVDMVTFSGDEAVIPEPGTIVALGSGLVGLVGVAIRRRK